VVDFLFLEPAKEASPIFDLWPSRLQRCQPIERPRDTGNFRLSYDLGHLLGGTSGGRQPKQFVTLLT
jgi:hypothetical protein